MSLSSVPKDILAQLAVAFLNGKRKHDADSITSMIKIAERLETENPELKIADHIARDFLYDQKQVDAYINECRKERKIITADFREKEKLERKYIIARNIKKFETEFAKEGITATDIRRSFHSTNPFVRYIAIKLMRGSLLRNLIGVAVGVSALGSAAWELTKFTTQYLWKQITSDSNVSDQMSTVRVNPSKTGANQGLTSARQDDSEITIDKCAACHTSSQSEDAFLRRKQPYHRYDGLMDYVHPIIPTKIRRWPQHRLRPSP